MEYWHKEFIYCQDRISDIPGNEYFSDEYRHHEPWYSTPIIRQLFEDSVTETNINNILDVGCGFGTMALYSQRLYDANVYCLDMENKTLPFPKIAFLRRNIEYDEFPFRWPYFYDKIIMTEVLEHLRNNPIPTLRKLNERLDDNGALYLSTPDACTWKRKTNYYSHIGEMPTPDPSNQIYLPDEHIYQYTEGEVLYILDQAGFVVEKKEYAKPPFWGRHLCVKAIKK
jgi:cyclopropane fatty-acyl-phospholipid synthase-like methyltransferase